MKTMPFGVVVAVLCCTILNAKNNQLVDTLSTSINYLNEIVLSDTRLPVKRSQSGKTVIQINRKQIESFRGRNLSELLASYGGMNIIGSRSRTGHNLRTAIRGSSNNQVLIMVDGVRVSDPSRIGSDFDLNFLNLEEVESIEILKGAASTLYGSAATAGVIQITTRANTQKNEFNVGLATGTEQAANQKLNSLSYFSNHLNYSGISNRFNYKLGYSVLSIDGMSAARNGIETDPFFRYNINAKLGYKDEKFDVQLLANKAQIKSDYDNGFPIEDADFQFFSFLESLTLKSKYQYDKGSIDLQAGQQTTQREYRSNFPSESEAVNRTVELVHKWNLSESLYSVQGLFFQEEQYDDFSVINQKDLFANMVYLSNGFNTNIGVRINDHQTYGSHFTYTVNPSYSLSLSELSKIKFFGSINSAFKAPTLFQLYAPVYGNASLNPEESQSLELGTEWADGKANASLVVFQRDEDSKVVYDSSTSTYANSPDGIVFRGVEFHYSNRLSEALNVRLNYTFTELKSGTIMRIPKHSANLQFGYTVNPISSLAAVVNYRGDRQAIDTSLLKSYSLLDLSYTKRIGQSLNIFVWVNNLLDTDYEEILNYSTLGRNFRVGLNVNF
ncbi:MAG: TonB-dependent receptor plug domain-containing protein [Flavobacteriaceae bacterium]